MRLVPISATAQDPELETVYTCSAEHACGVGTPAAPQAKKARGIHKAFIEHIDKDIASGLSPKEIIARLSHHFRNDKGLLCQVPEPSQITTVRIILYYFLTLFQRRSTILKRSPDVVFDDDLV